MAIMINCGMDWTYDMFMEDAKAYKATPIKGVHCNGKAECRERFMTWFKNLARDFKAEWDEEHGGRQYDRYDGYIGDAFARELRRADFSDYYKDAYGQRPHLADWFYVQAVRFPMNEDTSRTFCAFPIEQAMADARAERAV